MSHTDITQRRDLPMRVFVTGASGWIGSAAVAELLSAGHDVVGLARNDDSAAAISAAGAMPHAGDLDDLGSLRRGADSADAVVHLAFKHDFTDFAASGRTERAAIEAFHEVLAGSDRPFLFASGVATLAPGRVATEADASPYNGPDSPRGGAENLALSYVEEGMHPVALRFAPTVHGAGGDHGFVAVLARAARQAGQAAYVGDGSNRWAAVHRSDAGRLIALALEKAPAGSVLHAIGEEGIATRDIAAAIGERLVLPTGSVTPEEATERIGAIGTFFGMDMAASSDRTRELLGWAPTGPTLLEDIAAGHYPGT
jgi:nucleoside-diphosphate-sugar epimerase